MAAGPPPPVPLTVLTGFLGAGKTTLLNRLLRDPGQAGTVAIVNEFGEVGIDHHLVEAVDDGLVLLSAGCLCCTVRGDLVRTLEDLLRRHDNGRLPDFRQVVIETTGLADPAPVLGAVLYHPYLSRRYGVAGVVTVVDALVGHDTLDRHEEARRQVAVADRILLGKADLAEAAGQDLAPLHARLRGLNPAAPIDGSRPDRAEASLLPTGALFGSDGKIADVANWLRTEAETLPHGHHHHHHDLSRHDDRIASLVLAADQPVGQATLDLFLDLLRSSFGPRILRLKGLVNLREELGRPLVIHGVQHVLHVPALLPGWPDGDRRTRIVVIVEDVPVEAVHRMWDAFTGAPAVDKPDGAALADNPLAPATLAR